MHQETGLKNSGSDAVVNGKSESLERFAGGLIVGLSQHCYTKDVPVEEVGDDWLKFHFQLRGEACYSVAGEKDLRVEDLTCAIALHGKGIVKSGYVAAKPGFSVTVLCKPDLLRDRFGIGANNMPKSLSRYLEFGQPSWFSEVGRMTPAMAMTVRSLETMPFEGIMRRTYIEARGTELVCELWSEIGGYGCQTQPLFDGRTLAKVEGARAYIDEHFAAPLTAQQLARHTGTNVSKLSQAFRKVFGMTLFEYIRSRRMEAARQLLRVGNLTVTEIAFDVGYEHPCNFSVAYKRHFGVTPGEERNVRIC